MNKKENIDIAKGTIYPVNSKIQGETIESIKDFIIPRCRQLIKEVNYTMEVIYYPEGVVGE